MSALIRLAFASLLICALSGNTLASKPQLASIDPNNPVAPAGSEPPGDFMSSYFNPDSTLDVIWTRDELQIPGTATLTRDIFFARSY